MSSQDPHWAQPSPFQVFFHIVVAIELCQVDEHPRGTATITPAAVTAVTHPTTRRTDPVLQGRVGGVKGK